MKLVKGEGLDWGRVRELLEASACEMQTPDYLLDMEAMAEEDDEAVQSVEWPLVNLEGDNQKREVVAIVTEMVMRHDAFAHVQPGIWNHPINLSDAAVGQILCHLGYPAPASENLNPVGRVLDWP